MKKFLSAALMALSFTVSANTVFGADFNDVPESYWAYAEIMDIASKGYMTADTEGNFNPKNYIDKFDTSKILSLASGYNGNDTSSAQYSENKALVEQYKAKFQKWNSTADEAIIYLLGNGIFKSEDLAQFIITNSESKEQLRALSREEYAVFLVRLMGKEKEAGEYKSDYKFTDDSSMAESRKSSVYYLKNMGIISGNTDGKYNPKGAVTREEFCVLLSRTIENMPEDKKNAAVEKPAVSTTGTASAIVGTVEQIFPSLNVIQIKNNNETTLYKIKPDAVITANGYTASFDSIQPGMSVSAIIDNYEISALNASGNFEAPVTEVPAEISTASDIQTQAETQPSAETQTAVQTQSNAVCGSVVSANSSEIKFAYYKLSDYFAVEKKTLKSNSVSEINITRNGSPVSVEDITENEPAKVTLNGDDIASVELMGSSCIFNSAKIVKKYINSDNVTFIIQASDGGIYSFDTAEDTTVTRNGSAVIPSALIAGDKAAITVKNGKITAMAAIMAEPSVLSNMYVAELHLSQNYMCIGLSENADLSDSELYSLSDVSVNPYILKIGDKVRAGLEGSEITTLEIKESPESHSYTGIITDKKTSVITLSCLSAKESPQSAKVSYDTSTLFYDSTTTKALKFSELEENMLVYVTYEDDLDEDTIPVAKSITVIRRK